MNSGESTEWEDVNTATLVVGDDGPQGRPVAYLEFIIGSRTGEMMAVSDDATLTFGCAEAVDLQLGDSTVSEEHARLVCNPEGVLLEDLGSKFGTFVNGERIEKRKLADRDEVGFGTRVVARFIYADQAEEKRQQQIYDSGVCDQVTGLPNQQYFLERLDDEVSWSKRHKAPLVLIGLAIDGEQALLERVGSEAMDVLLRNIGRTLRSSLRTEDLLGRLASGAFAIACRGIRAQIGIAVADRLRGQVAVASYASSKGMDAFSLSVGIAGLPNSHVTSSGRLFDAVEKALKEALNSGDASALAEGTKG